MKADHTPAELQKYWDACLIRGWREFQQISDVVFAYQSIAIGWDVPTAGIRRMPQYGMPWSTSSRAFGVAVDIADADLAAIAGGVFAAGNVIVTAVTSKRAGLPAPVQADRGPDFPAIDVSVSAARNGDWRRGSGGVEKKPTPKPTPEA